jgi:cytochrome b6-f complex iron-sulfur subunit
MNGVAIVAIVLVLLALASIVLLGAARRRETDTATGRLSRETRRRDRSGTASLPEDAPATGREVEKAAAAGTSLAVPSREIEAAKPTTPVPWVPPDPETIGVTRRQFLNRSIINVMGFSLTAFGLACIGFLWPSGTGGFGSKIRIGKIDDIIANIKANQGFAYYPEARMWATEYPESSLEKAKKVYPPALLTVLEAGVVPLYQRCVHLGCRVPQCLTSQWFECPCHGSQYNRVGEKKGGPAPRGLDRFTPTLDGGILTVDTGTIILGPPIGTNTTGQEAEGPHCIGGSGEHKA